MPSLLLPVACTPISFFIRMPRTRTGEAYLDRKITRMPRTRTWEAYTVDLPTPPLALDTAMMRLTSLSPEDAAACSLSPRTREAVGAGAGTERGVKRADGSVASSISALDAER